MSHTQDFQWTDERVRKAIDGYRHVKPQQPTIESFIEQFKREQSPSSVSDAAVKAITSFKNCNVDEVRTWEWAKGGNFVDKRDWCEYMLSKQSRIIWSVTNESGVVFTVKENALSRSDNPHGEPFEIAYFKPVNNRVGVYGNAPHEPVTLICYTEDLRKPVPSWSFTTHDGVEIKDKQQKVFGAYPIKHGTEFTTYEKSVGELEGAKGWTWFSTREARDEYVRLNTKDYSLQQIQDALKSVSYKWFSEEDQESYADEFFTALTNSNS